MATEMMITFKIDLFCACLGCVKRVKDAFSKLHVTFLAEDPKIGKFTILTTHHHEVIKYALEKSFPYKNIILSQAGNKSYPVPMLDVNDIANTFVTMSRAKGLESAEYTHSDTFKVYFTKQPTVSTLPPTPYNLRCSNGVCLEDAPLSPPPPINIAPSAPPMPTIPDPVYGYPPPEFYRYDKNHPHGCCTIL